MNTLETARLVYRPIVESDFDGVHDVYSDAETMTFHGDGPFDRATTRAWMERTLSRYDGGELGFRAVIHKDSGEYVGHIGLLPQEAEGMQLTEVGYWLRRRFWRQGYATEGARALRDEGFRRMEVPRIVSLIHPGNLASQAVALKNDMQREREVTWRGHAHFLYSITRALWENLPRTDSP
jgi:ribosomal-protein-alanine N-acetyltransferase